MINAWMQQRLNANAYKDNEDLSVQESGTVNLIYTGPISFSGQRRALAAAAPLEAYTRKGSGLGRLAFGWGCAAAALPAAWPPGVLRVHTLRAAGAACSDPAAGGTSCTTSGAGRNRRHEGQRLPRESPAKVARPWRLTWLRGGALGSSWFQACYSMI